MTAPLDERQDAAELFECIAARFRSGQAIYTLRELSEQLDWPQDRVVIAAHVLEVVGLIIKPPTGRES